MSSNRNKHIECDICKNLIRSDSLHRHMQRVDHQLGSGIEDDIKRHMKTHEKGSGLWTQTVNDQMKWGYGLKSKHDVDEQKHDGGVDDEDDADSDTDAESETDSMDDSASVSESESVSDLLSESVSESESPLHPTPLSCLDFKPYPHFI